jgi:hypothetical protein
MKKFAMSLIVLMSLISSQVLARGHDYGNMFRFGINLYPQQPVYQQPQVIYVPQSPSYVNYNPAYVTPACYPGQLYTLEGVMVMGRQPIPIFNYNNQIMGYTCK